MAVGNGMKCAIGWAEWVGGGLKGIDFIQFDSVGSAKENVAKQNALVCMQYN